jgi:uncharacterized protein
MTNAEHERRIDYIEFSVKSVADAKRFYGSAFGWTFEDYGPDYASFADGRLSGGFQTAAKVQTGGPLVVIYAVDLEAAEKRVSRRAARSCARFSAFRAAGGFTLPIPAATSWRCGRWKSASGER